MKVAKSYEQNSDGVNTTTAFCVSANILQVDVQENGYQGGDAGNGGFVKITLSDRGGTAMEARVNGESLKDADEIEIVFRGDCERDTLKEALKVAVDALDTFVAQ